MWEHGSKLMTTATCLILCRHEGNEWRKIIKTPIALPYGTTVVLGTLTSYTSIERILPPFASVHCEHHGTGFVKIQDEHTRQPRRLVQRDRIH